MTDVDHETDRVPIGTFARAARITVKALRHYDTIGLLTPAWVDPRSQYRYYDWNQLDGAICIATLRSIGIPLDRIADHLVGGSPLRDVLDIERDRLRGERRQIDEALQVIDTVNSMGALSPGRVQLIQRDDIPTLSTRARAQPDTLHHDTERLIERLLRAAERAGVDLSPPVIGEFPLDLADKVTIAVHLPVTEPITPHAVEGAEPSILPGGRFSSTLHIGPHHTLALAYRDLLASGTHHRSRPAAPLVDDIVIERYLDDPTHTPAADVRTEVMVRLST